MEENHGIATAKTKHTLTLMGFAQKAGKLAAGEAAVENFLEKGQVKLLVLSTELSAQRKADWQRQADQHHIHWLTLEADKAQIGLAVGMSPRGVVGILDQNMAEAIMKNAEN